MVWAARVAGGLALLLLLVPTATPAAAAAGISMQVVAGFDGYARLGGWLPLNIEIDNGGGDVSAELVAQQSVPPTAPAPQPAYAARYSLSVFLPHGAHKRYPLHIPLQGLGRDVDVELRTGSMVLAHAAVPITVIGPEQVLVGLVADRSAALPALGRVQIPEVRGVPATPRVAGLAPGELPVYPEELSGFDVLVFAHASTDQLTPDQRTALEGWVARGGLLILSGGSDWGGTSAGLPPDLLPVRAPRLRTLPTLAALGGFAGQTGPGNGPSVVTIGEIRGHVLVQQDGVPLLALMPYGHGTVAFSAADLTSPPLTAWPGEPDLWQHLLQLGLPPTTLAAPTMSGQVYYDPKAILAGALSSLPPAASPSWRLLCGILLLYLLAAPGSWLLLRRLGRPGLTWLALPTLSLGFALWTFGVAFRERGGVAVVNAITVAEYPANTAVGQVTSYLGLYAPNEQTYHVRFAAPALLSSMATPIFKRLPTDANQPVPLGLDVREEGPQVDLLPTARWTARAVHTARWVAAASGITASLTPEADALGGTITNRTGQTLTDCAISAPWGAKSLGTLPAGASASFHLSRQRGLTPSLQQLFAFSPDQQSWPLAQQRRRQVQQQMINSLWSYAGPFGPNDAHLGPLLFIGWGDPAPVGLTVDGRAVPEAGVGLLVVGLAVPDAPAASVPAGLLDTRYVAGGAGAMQKGNTINLNHASITVSAPLPLAASVLRAVTLRLTSPVMGTGMSVSVAVLNQRTGRYDPVPLTTPGVATPGVTDVIARAPTPTVTPARLAATTAPVVASAAVAAKVGAVAIGPRTTEWDAILTPGDLRLYLDAQNAVTFRITSMGANLILNWPLTYGYTVAGQP